MDVSWTWATIVRDASDWCTSFHKRATVVGNILTHGRPRVAGEKDLKAGDERMTSSMLLRC